jgi:hypothetical protein
MANLILLAGLVALAYVTKTRGWAPGDGPFDLLPEGVTDQPIEKNKTFAASGKQYEITSYKRGADQIYHVAVRTTGTDWIAFIVDNAKATRVLYRAHGGNAKALDDLRKDFAL